MKRERRVSRAYLSTGVGGADAVIQGTRLPRTRMVSDPASEVNQPLYTWWLQCIPQHADFTMFDRRGSQQPVMGSPARSSTPTHNRAKSLSAMGHLGQSGSGTASVPMSPSASSSAARQYASSTTGQSSPVVGGVPMSPAASGWTMGTPGTPGPSFGRETEWSDIQGRTFCKWSVGS